jgi:hypothetical protein
MILPGETEAGTARGRKHAEGYPGGLIESMNVVRLRALPTAGRKQKKPRLAAGL